MTQVHSTLFLCSSSRSLCSCGRKQPTRLCHCFPSILLLLRDQETFHPQGTDWYKEPFAWFLSTGMRSYESEVIILVNFRNVSKRDVTLTSELVEDSLGGSNT
ncbi:unnamed protein product [Brassica rapa subsp. trilocularis]